VHWRRRFSSEGAGMCTVGNRRVGGVGSFTGSGATFYRAEAWRGAGVPLVAGVEGASMSRLEGVGYWRSEEGGAV
jgi:hypothetical protein